MKSIGLLLLGKKGLISLDDVINSEEENKSKIQFVVIGRDKNILNDYSEEIKNLCINNNITWYNKSNFTKEYPRADLLIAIGWRWLIDTSKYDLIVFHDSLLPKYRGFNPLVTALIEGDDKVGVSAIRASAEFDKGNIIYQEPLDISYPVKIKKVINDIAVLYGKLLLKIIKMNDDESKGIKQIEEEATYSLWRNEEDYKIAWCGSAITIKRFIDSVGFPYLGAKTMYNGKSIRILDANVESDLNIINRSPGKILKITSNKPFIVCGTGLLRINKAKYENGDSVVFNKLRVRLQ